MKSSINENTQVNMEDWFPVDTSNFNSFKLKKYKQRKRALDLYLSSHFTLNEVSEMTRLSESEIKRIRKRALTQFEDGSYYGYLACIPNLNLKGYKRTNNIKKSGGGQFTFFLEQNPEIKFKLESWALGRSSPTHVAVRGRFYKRIYKCFRQLCIDKNINVATDYPFTNKDLGMGAVRNYCIKIKKEHFAQAAKVDFGDIPGRLCINSTHTKPSIESLRPYDVVQLDGHKVDSEVSVKLLDEYGNTQYVPLSRVWLLTVIDTASRAVLGYYVSLSQNYTMEDVLGCIASALDCSEDALLGLPTREIEECKGRLFNCIKFDNAYAQISTWLQEKLIDAGVQEVISNRASRPRSNAIVERFFRTLEEESIHQFPTTTGSHIKDPRRRNPLKAANELAIHLEDIENALKLTIEWYNNAPHTSLNGISPIEFLKYSVDQQSDLIRSLNEPGVSVNELFRRQFPLTIRGNKSQGHQPYIQFKSARYTSKGLIKCPDLIGQSAVFETDIRDIRKGSLFLTNGKFIDEVTVSQKWATHKHSLRDRIAITKLAREKKINYGSCSPLIEYTDFLAERSLTSRKERNEYIRVGRSLSGTGIKEQSKKREVKVSLENTISLSKISNVR